MTDTKVQKLYRVELLLENGLVRELLSEDPSGIKHKLEITEDQANDLEKAISSFDGMYIHEAKLDDLTDKQAPPQLALTETHGTRFWISGNPALQGDTVRVVEVRFRSA